MSENLPDPSAAPAAAIPTPTIVFDLDGTLVDTAPDLLPATNHTLATLNIAPIDAPTLRGYVGQGARRMIERGLEAAGRTATETEFEALLEVFLAHYEANIAVHSQPFEGLVPALDALAAQSFKLAVCTNKSEKLARKLLAELGLLDRFQGLAGRDTFPVYKPDPRHLTGAIELAGGDPQRAIMIGDSKADVGAAKAAGIPVIACTFGYSDVPIQTLGADREISHFSELNHAVLELLGSSSS